MLVCGLPSVMGDCAAMRCGTMGHCNQTLYMHFYIHRVSTGGHAERKVTQEVVCAERLPCGVVDETVFHVQSYLLDPCCSLWRGLT